MGLTIATTSIPGDLAAKLRAIADAGFDGIELHEPDFTGYHGDADDVRRMAFDLGLSIEVFQPFHDFEGLAGDARRAAFDRLRRKLDLMMALGAQTLLIGASTRDDASAGENVIAGDFRELADCVEQRGLRAAFLALPWACHQKTEIAASQLVQMVGHPNFGLALNSFFSLANGSQPARLRALLGEKIFHVQLSDAPRLDFNFRNLERPLGLLPGQGDLNLASFVRVVAKSGYQGSWSVARVQENDAADVRENIARDGYRAIANLLDEVARTEPEIAFPIPKLPERVYASGFEFIEFAANEESGEELAGMLASLCFRKERQHVSKSVELWRQGAVNIVVNSESRGFAKKAFDEHGPTVCDMGIRVRDADKTVERASILGAPRYTQKVGTGELEIPAIRGVGGNVVHFIDEKSNLHRVWDIEFAPVPKTRATPPAGLRRVDHVAQTMAYSEMQSWLTYYTSTFEMKKTPIVNVADPSGVVLSQAISSPEGEVRLNLNGARSRRTLAGSFLRNSLGAGVQHIAFLTDDIFETSARLRETGFSRLPIPQNYYDDLQSIFSLSQELLDALREGRILYDSDGRGEYFQIYGTPMFKGFFFEVVERRGGYRTRRKTPSFRAGI